jgi:glycosyltransferase involved in cell wall biosynthesis
MSMRVLHFFKTYFPETTGGTQQVIFQLCQGGPKNGVENSVLTLSPEPYPADVQVGDHQVRRVKENISIASTGFSLQAFRQFKEMAAESDVVHFHFPWPMMDMVHFATRHGRPTVVGYHSDIVRQQALLALYNPLMKRFLQSVDRITVASPNYQRTSLPLQPFADKTVVIPYGLDPTTYPEPSAGKQAYWRERLPAKFFLFVGVLRYYKGLSSLLDALVGTGYPVVILGAGPQELELKAQAEKLQLQNVFFVGRQEDEDKVALLQLCYGMVFPSHLRSEAFGISLLEASMYGKPMISCEIGTGTTYVNLDGETGLSVPPDSPIALRQAMKRLWDDEGEAKRFGGNAMTRFRRMFTAEHMCAATAAVYRELLEGRG